MNRKQFQINVCKALLDSNRRCSGTQINNNEFVVTFDGCTAFVFDKNECVFSFEKVKQYEGLKDVCSDNENDVLIEKTSKQYIHKGEIIEVYKGENIVLYANTKCSKLFAGCKLFAYAPLQRILAKDEFGRLVGVFLPVRYNEEDA